MRTVKRLVCICPVCWREMTLQSGSLSCPVCERQVDLLRTSEKTRCRCLFPQIRRIAGRDICLKCGGRVVAGVARKPTKRQLLYHMEF